MPVIILFALFILLYLMINKEEFLTISAMEKCKDCGMSIDSFLLHCPYCKKQVKNLCKHCGRLIDYDWKSCPFCESIEENRVILNEPGGRK